MFEGWDNYLVMMGTASAGLIGLLFVVITLTSGFDRNNALRGQALYMTPTMVNFAVVFALSAVAEMPRLPPAGFVGLAGVALGLGFANAVRASLGIATPRAGAPIPHWSDFWMYGATPGALYALGLVAVWLTWRGSQAAAAALFGLLLIILLVGVRNAWDLITWIAPGPPPGDPQWSQPPPPPLPPPPAAS
jgi:hypothetical protein